MQQADNVKERGRVCARRNAGGGPALLLLLGLAGVALAQPLPQRSTNPPPPPPLPPRPARTTPRVPTAPAGVMTPTVLGARPATTRVLEPFPLSFDADVKEVSAKPGDTNIVFTFTLTNSSTAAVTIERVQTSCGCTTTKLPALPWQLQPGATSAFSAVLDLRGRRGQLNKMVYVYTSRGFKALTIRGLIPEPTALASGDRLRNQQRAAADRQVVFKADCARCHRDPGQGKQGRELFQAVCAVCHEAEHRAVLVPDLRTLSHPTGPEYWRQWVTNGKAGTLMPAFAESEGGPLSKAQIESLVEYLDRRLPSTPAPAPLPTGTK